MKISKGARNFVCRKYRLGFYVSLTVFTRRQHLRGAGVTGNECSIKPLTASMDATTLLFYLLGTVTNRPRHGNSSSFRIANELMEEVGRRRREKRRRGSKKRDVEDSPPSAPRVLFYAEGILPCWHLLDRYYIRRVQDRRSFFRL